MCVCVCVFIHLSKIYLQQQFVGLACYKHSPSPHDHPSRPLLDAIRLNRSRRKPCPSVNSQNVAISLVIRYYRCRDLETCLTVESEKLNQSRYRYQTRCPKHSPMSISTVMTSHTWDIASAISVKGFTATRIAHSFRSFIK